MPVVASSFTHAVSDGPPVVHAGVALAVGVLGFLSPCVLPLVPGYLSYVASLSTAPDGVVGSGRSDGRGPTGPTGPTTLTAQTALTRALTRSVRQRRIVAGAVLFVAGFSAIFIAEGVLFGSLGAAIRDNT